MYQYPTRGGTPPPTGRPAVDDSNPWLLWRPQLPHEKPNRMAAELAECRCPDLCDRDHDNE